jgi:hypothetical protein
MTINIPAIHDALVAISVAVGIAVALSIAIIAIAAVLRRGKGRRVHAVRASTSTAEHVTQADDPRRLVLR